MMRKKPSTLYASLAAVTLCAIIFAASASVASAKNAKNQNKVNVGTSVQLCLQARREGGYFNKDLTRAERRALQIEFRKCVHAAVKAKKDSKSSSSRSSSSSTSSTSSVSSSSVSSSSVASSTSSLAVHRVSIQNFAYVPQVLTVKKGTTVRWRNTDRAPHTVTSDTGSILNSGRLNRGDRYAYTFNSTGSYAYHCKFHPEMKGTVVVTD